MIWSALQASLWFGRFIVQSELNRRAQVPTAWPTCPKCSKKLQSKGFQGRQLKTMIGTVRWKRRVGRCPQGCQGSQRVPLDEALGLSAYQATDEGLLRLGCLLSVVMPYGLASWLLGQWSGVRLSASSLWNAVQYYGAHALSNLELELAAFEQGKLPEPEALCDELQRLTLAICADGVMVPFRPHNKTPKGTTQYREVKVGLLARFKQRLTKTNQQVTQLCHKRVVAVLGDLDAFMPRITWEAHRQSMTTAVQVLWLSDGAKGFWRVYRECFATFAIGILDFYHATGHLWRATVAIFDGRTTEAHNWFVHWRHLLRHGQHRQVLTDLTRLVNIDVFEEQELDILTQVHGYFHRHHEHIRYAHFKDRGYPLGSGMIESTCKWLIQQRFKGVGMRWSEDGFNHLLHLRMAWVNQRFDCLFPHVDWVDHLPSPNL
jgi:hypothetical protein